MVFELLNSDMGKLVRGRGKQEKSESEIRSIMYQAMRGLHYMHKQGFFHRDLKPENILVGSGCTIKLSDFGLVREIKSMPPYTEYVSTRWYRAPECVLRAKNYSSPVDIFAMGCIFAELYTLRPLFPGQSELDQMNKVRDFLLSCLL